MNSVHNLSICSIISMLEWHMTKDHSSLTNPDKESGDGKGSQIEKIFQFNPNSIYKTEAPMRKVFR